MELCIYLFIAFVVGVCVGALALIMLAVRPAFVAQQRARIERRERDAFNAALGRESNKAREAYEAGIRG